MNVPRFSVNSGNQGLVRLEDIWIDGHLSRAATDQRMALHLLYRTLNDGRGLLQVSWARGFSASLAHLGHYGSESNPGDRGDILGMIVRCLNSMD